MAPAGAIMRTPLAELRKQPGIADGRRLLVVRHSLV